MPPNLDIYGLTRRREADIIHRFLDHYVDRMQCENRGDEALMLRKLDAPANSDVIDDYEWEPALTLAHTVQRGLEYPRRSFMVYLTAKHPDIDQAILGFTTDNQLVLGLSIDDAEGSPENLERAKALLSQLAQNYGCHRGLILAEQPPPHSESMFEQEPQAPYSCCLYSCIWPQPI